MYLASIIIVTTLFPVWAIIMPISKPDGTMDMTSLLSHISLLEQRDEKLESQLTTALHDLTVTQTKLDRALIDLKDLSNLKTEQRVTQGKLDTALEELKDLSNVKTELAVLQSQIQSGNSQCSCGSSGNFGGQPAQDLSGLQADVSALKSEVDQLQSLTNNTDVSGLSSDLSSLKSEVTQLKTLANQTDVSHLSADVSIIKTEMFQLQSLYNRTATSQGMLQGSSVYIRWGRTSCPSGNNMVYKGDAAGSYFDGTGGSAAMVCLPEHPIYSNNTVLVGGHTLTSLLYGTEYMAHETDLPFYHLSRENMPCAVCESKRATSIMVPARNACYQGWTREYSGFLMGGFKDHSSADYICVDSDAEAIPGGHAEIYGRVLYPVESKCGALACPPYEDGNFVTCVVCSK